MTLLLLATMHLFQIGIEETKALMAKGDTLKLKIKNFICWLGLGGWLREYCCKCGVKQPVYWWAEASLWHDVIGDESAVVCPRCFDKVAESRGFSLKWVPYEN